MEVGLLSQQCTGDSDISCASVPPFLAQIFMEESGLSHETDARTRSEVEYITSGHSPLVKRSHMAPSRTANEGEENEKGFCDHVALSLPQLTKHPSQYFSPTQNTPYLHFLSKEYNPTPNPM